MVRVAIRGEEAVDRAFPTPGPHRLFIEPLVHIGDLGRGKVNLEPAVRAWPINEHHAMPLPLRNNARAGQRREARICVQAQRRAAILELFNRTLHSFRRKGAVHRVFQRIVLLLLLDILPLPSLTADSVDHFGPDRLLHDCFLVFDEADSDKCADDKQDAEDFHSRGAASHVVVFFFGARLSPDAEQFLIRLHTIFSIDIVLAVFSLTRERVDDHEYMETENGSENEKLLKATIITVVVGGVSRVDDPGEAR